MTDQTAIPEAVVDWQDGVPVARAFDDPYFSLRGGLEEARHVALAANGLPGRFRDGFSLLELGFGAGLNFLAVLRAHREAGSPGRLRFASFEGFPMAAGDRARALSAFPEVAAEAAELSRALAAPGPWHFGPVTLEVVEGDARATLPGWDGRADAVVLDGFAPAKNPEMWEAPLLSAVACHMAPGATLATYTAAGHVRRALAEAGLAVERRPGFAGKRHMTVARRP